MLEDVKKRVYEANLKLANSGLVVLTWGNVSEIDRNKNLVVIKPSGIEYESMTADDMVVVDLNTGEVVDGKYRPSSDTPTHLELYRMFPEIIAITHTHSTNAVAFAQAGKDIVALGTTHADHFNGDVPCTRDLRRDEVESNYEKNTGKVIIEEIAKRGLPVMDVPAVLVRHHGPFVWGESANESVINAIVLEKVAEMSIRTILIGNESPISNFLLKRHYSRKHGPNSYYGQKKTTR